MIQYNLTIGLFDKNLNRQIISNDDARNIISDTLINDHKIYAFTQIDCYGVYKMDSTGAIVREPSIRVEIATEHRIKRPALDSITTDLKARLNQESIMASRKYYNIKFMWLKLL